jgi:predicted RNase H-like HicB family nuclease
VPALPGVLSEGETLAETLGNIAEAITASLQSYLSSDDTAIPWQTIHGSPEDEGSYWLAVNV